jgi:hypothetical protein
MFKKITSDRDPRDTVFSELNKEFKPYFGKFRKGVKTIADQYPKFLFCMMVINIVLSVILSLTVLRPAPEKKKTSDVSAVAPVSTGFDRILQAGATLRQTIRLKKQIDSLSRLPALTKADSAALLCDLDSLRHISLTIYPNHHEH